MYILGINSAYHESSACLVRDGELLAFVEEERCNRIKHAKISMVNNPDEIPFGAIDYCLNYAGISLADIDHFSYSFVPSERLNNMSINDEFEEGHWGSKIGEETFNRRILSIPSKFDALLNSNISLKFHWVRHHLCHAGSAFFVSPFENAAILSVDGIGEFTTTLLALGTANNIQVVKEIVYPNSIGLLWEKVSKYLGFSEYDAAKLMGLSAYGKPDKFLSSFKSIVTIGEEGNFTINDAVTKLRKNDFSGLEALFGKKRDSIDEIDERHADIAAALQTITGEVLLSLVQHLHEQAKCENLCIAGGVGLNCVANKLIADSGLFKNLYIQPASNDAGTAIGAAYYTWNHLLNNKRTYVMDTAYLGPEYSKTEILAVLRRNNLKYQYCENIEKEVAKLISSGKVVGWFQGRMEGGPRGLGNRSLLADPRNPEIRNILNVKVKHREYFRPFAPSVMEDKANEWFVLKENPQPYYFMLMVCNVRPNKRHLIPAVIHVDETSRIHLVKEQGNSKFYKLIKEFEKITGIPLVLNTSFNDREPIVCTPQDAVNTFLRTRIDAIALGDYLLLRGIDDNA